MPLEYLCEIATKWERTKKIVNGTDRTRQYRLQLENELKQSIPTKSLNSKTTHKMLTEIVAMQK